MKKLNYFELENTIGGSLCSASLGASAGTVVGAAFVLAFATTGFGAAVLFAAIATANAGASCYGSGFR